ncbi:DUF397 domain-containing protein [Nocardia ninae]|uniref:DUF397 domain-containing protein n=1 Tax=Nocardia ninae NBRC 108245 TaxID=1210091 RepID=A0A511M9Y7_9NOCA|nr:DUF397 domain-containing protein [Nocardia ninae]GEM37473.1 hypothetical protein NN4_19920 [Nocardia ninae NBRC 108245]
MSAIKPAIPVGGGFYKPSRSNDGPNCVSWKFVDGRVLIQDSKYAGDPDKQPTIDCTDDQWAALLELTLSANSGTTGNLEVVLHSNGAGTLKGVDVEGQPVRLDYTPTEWDFWAKGVADGEAHRP